MDKLILRNQEHYHLDIEDDCFFFGEYASRQNYSHSDVNQFVLNFKKSKDREVFPFEWRYKIQAIRQAAAVLAAGLGSGENLNAMRTATLVPVPPSKCPSDPMYDDRLIRMLSSLEAKTGKLDIRPLVRQSENYEASHSATCRLTPSELSARYTIDESFTQPTPKAIWIFDDVLVSGSHYKAMLQVLRARFPYAEFVGIFLARRVTAL